MNLAKQIQFMFNDKGKKTFAVLPISTYEKLQDVYEELEAIKAFDKAKRSKDKVISLDQMLKETSKIRNKK